MKTGPYIYSFRKSWYENYRDNIKSGINSNGGFVRDIWDPWLEESTTGLEVDILPYIRIAYSNAEVVCLDEKINREISEAIGNILGCGVGQALYDFTEAVEDAVGTVFDAAVSFVTNPVGTIRSWFHR